MRYYMPNGASSIHNLACDISYKKLATDFVMNN